MLDLTLLCLTGVRFAISNSLSEEKKFVIYFVFLSFIDLNVLTQVEKNKLPPQNL